MIQLIRIEKQDPDTYVAVVDKHGTELRFEFKIARSEEISVVPWPSAMEDAFIEYALDSPPGRPRGALVIPIVQKVAHIVGDIDNNIEHNFPIMLHLDE
jgi:hypothetical protein